MDIRFNSPPAANLGRNITFLHNSGQLGGALLLEAPTVWSQEVSEQSLQTNYLFAQRCRDKYLSLYHR